MQIETTINGVTVEFVKAPFGHPVEESGIRFAKYGEQIVIQPIDNISNMVEAVLNGQNHQVGGVELAWREDGLTVKRGATEIQVGNFSPEEREMFGMCAFCRSIDPY